MYDMVAAIGQVGFWFILLAPLGQVVVELIDRRRYGRLELKPRSEQDKVEFAAG